jgi:hypothetical protein
VTCPGHWRCRCISSSGPSDASRVWCSCCRLPEDDAAIPGGSLQLLSRVVTRRPA